MERNGIPVRVGDLIVLDSDISFVDRSRKRFFDAIDEKSRAAREGTGKSSADLMAFRTEESLRKGTRILITSLGIEDPYKPDTQKREEICAKIVIMPEKRPALINYDHIRYLFSNDRAHVIKNILEG